MAHGQIGIVEGYALANVDSVEIVVKGVGGHGSMPHLTKDPIVLASHIVLALQTIVSREVRPGDPAVVTVGSIHGGTKSNIISDEVRLQLTLRSYQTDTRKKLIESIQRIVKAQAESANMPADKMPEVIVSEDSASALYNQPALCAEVRATLEPVLGAQNVLVREPVMGAEDFSEYGMTKDKVPLCMFWLGTQSPTVVAEAKAKGTTLPSLHSPYFKPVPEPSIETGVKAMASAVIGLMKR
jgi:hippurate hydrolase